MKSTTVIRNGIRREYRTVEVPSDCADTLEERQNIAFMTAYDEFPTYRMPSETHIVWDRGEYVRVCRLSHV